MKFEGVRDNLITSAITSILKLWFSYVLYAGIAVIGIAIFFLLHQKFLYSLEPKQVIEYIKTNINEKNFLTLLPNTPLKQLTKLRYERNGSLFSIITDSLFTLSLANFILYVFKQIHLGLIKNATPLTQIGYYCAFGFWLLLSLYITYFLKDLIFFKLLIKVSLSVKRVIFLIICTLGIILRVWWTAKHSKCSFIFCIIFLLLDSSYVIAYTIIIKFAEKFAIAIIYSFILIGILSAILDKVKFGFLSNPSSQR